MGGSIKMLGRDVFRVFTMMIRHLGCCEYKDIVMDSC